MGEREVPQEVRIAGAKETLKDGLEKKQGLQIILNELEQ
jgi:hypothetical protein